MTVQVLTGDCRTLLAEQGDRQFQACVTSPPYWGLRDYGHADQLGLERDPRDYLRHMVAVFREVRRTLRDDGTLWLNMGDCYTDGGRGADHGSTLDGARDNQRESRKATTRQHASPFGLGRKQLIGMPWRLALALQDDGWVLRRDIIWHKTNPMPESCTDRATTAHEYLFQFSKRHRYHYDYVAALEPVTGRAHRRGSGVGPKSRDRMPTGWDTGPGRHADKTGNYTAGRAARAQSRLREHRELEQGKMNASMQSAVVGLVAERNARSVWTIPTSPFKGAHFATYPPALAARCLRAGTSPHVCSCGAPWRRLYRKEVRYEGHSAEAGRTPEEIRASAPKGDARGGRDASLRAGPVLHYQTIGWTATCRHASVPDAEGRGAVLDPFGGALTTAMVADDMGLDCVTMEVNPAYDFRYRLARQLSIEEAMR